MKTFKTFKTSLVDVAAIKGESGTLCKAKLDLVRQLGGFIKPFVVRDLFNGQYEIVCGHDLLAIARELEKLDLDTFEMIRCYVVDNDIDEELATQLFIMS